MGIVFLLLLVGKKTIDLTTKGTREVNIAPCICNRYDAGICKHKLERAGVFEIAKGL